MGVEWIGEGVGFIPGAVNVGVIKSGSDAILVDTGLDKDTGRRIARTIEAEGLHVKAVINTHSHADHYGGNGYLARNHGVEVYASETEAALIENPILEPIYLWGGAYPLRELMNKFSMGEACHVHHRVKPGPAAILSRELFIHPLPGHSINQIGVEASGALFCGDSVFSQQILEKHVIPVMIDFRREYETLDWLEKTQFKVIIPSHGDPCTDPRELVEANRRVLKGIEEKLLEIASEPVTTGDAAANLCRSLGMELKSVQQATLIQMTVQAALSYLSEEGKLSLRCEGNRILWRRV